jgi:RHS repeat-associated protein
MPQTFKVSGTAKSAPWMGRRIRSKVTKLDTSTVTQDNKFIYDGWNPLTELDASNARVRTFLWGSDLSGSMQGAGGVGGLLKVTTQTPSSSTFVAYDGNGNVTAPVDHANGAQSMHAQYEYGPFGELVRSSGSMAKVNPFRFSTKYQDDESDLLYYGYRYYNPSTGRWISRDPLWERAFRQMMMRRLDDPLGSSAGVKESEVKNSMVFVQNRTLALVDSVGLWSPNAHHFMIDFALAGRVKPAFLQLVKEGSDWVDSKWNQAFSPAHWHYLREEGQTRENALALWTLFVDDNLLEAQRLASLGLCREALDRLGRAVHGLNDWSSPVHRDSDGLPMLWKADINHPNFWRHSPSDNRGEDRTADIDVGTAAIENALIRGAYNRVFRKKCPCKVEIELRPQ